MPQNYIRCQYLRWCQHLTSPGDIESQWFALFPYNQKVVGRITGLRSSIWSLRVLSLSVSLCCEYSKLTVGLCAGAVKQHFELKQRSELQEVPMF